MPFIQAPQSPPDTVELRGKLSNRFYEPLVLLLAATKACMHNLAPKILEHHADRAHMTPKEIFHDFLNKLAQICDNVPTGGATVTAVAVLHYPHVVQYRFASNGPRHRERDEQERERLRFFIESVLKTLRDWVPSHQNNEKDRQMTHLRILYKVVLFNRRRLQAYVKSLAEHSVKSLASGVAGLAPEVVEKLKEISKLAVKANNKELSDDEFFVQIACLTSIIRRFSRHRAYVVLRDKADSAQKGDRGSSTQRSCWAEMRHAAARLQSYHEGIDTFLEARSKTDWEMLFHDFEVVVLPPSRPIDHSPCRRDGGADNILNRFYSSDNADTLSELKRCAAELQQFGLDEHIRQQRRSETFRPIVHAELLVHESIVTDTEGDSLHGARFFEGYRYIGCSKPTCRLCHYYLNATGDAIETRQTHRNLYANWRAPDVLRTGGAQQSRAEKRREDLLNTVVKSLRKDTQRVLTDKVAERKAHDSNTSRTYKRTFSLEYSSVGGAGGTVFEEDETNKDEDEDEDGGAELASVMGQCDINDVDFQ